MLALLAPIVENDLDWTRLFLGSDLKDGHWTNLSAIGCRGKPKPSQAERYFQHRDARAPRALGQRTFAIDFLEPKAGPCACDTHHSSAFSQGQFRSWRG
jgi:hypothetical protein